MTVRSLALGQINTVNWRAVLRGEIGLSLVNGVVWGGLVAVFAYWLYGRVDLALVLFFSMGFCFLAARHLRFYGAVTNAKTRQRPGTWRYGRFDRYHGYFGVFRVPWAGLATFDIRALFAAIVI